ncbi:MAG: hypothetical protein QOK36_3781, partial [Gaiellales bacterium]|nr:hypothetical protein [Gaiellales bacterium]
PAPDVVPAPREDAPPPPAVVPPPREDAPPPPAVVPPPREDAPPPPTPLRPPTSPASPPPSRPFRGESASFRSAIDAARERVHGAAREATPDEGESTEPLEDRD